MTEYRIYFYFRIQIEIDQNERKFRIALICNYLVSLALMIAIGATNLTLLLQVCTGSSEK